MILRNAGAIPARPFYGRLKGSPMLGHNRKMSGAECLAAMIVFLAVCHCLSMSQKLAYYSFFCACLPSRVFGYLLTLEEDGGVGGG
jgi:hypothetical protein